MYLVQVKRACYYSVAIRTQFYIMIPTNQPTIMKKNVFFISKGANVQLFWHFVSPAETRDYLYFLTWCVLCLSLFFPLPILKLFFFPLESTPMTSQVYDYTSQLIFWKSFKYNTHLFNTVFWSLAPTTKFNISSIEWN